MNSLKLSVVMSLVLALASISLAEQTGSDKTNAEKASVKSDLLSTEKLSGEVWLSPNVKQLAKSARRVTVKVWFEDQFLGRGDSYKKRAQEFSKSGRRQLRKQVVATLQKTSDATFAVVEKEISKLKEEGVISNFQRHWIVNGFTCTTTIDELDRIKRLPKVKKIFVGRRLANIQAPSADAGRQIAEIERGSFDPEKFKHPWYIRSLLADKVWKEFGVTGQGTLNVVHDFNFAFPKNLQANIYRNPNEIAGNGKDDDGNGLIDDVHGYNFQANSAKLNVQSGSTPRTLHGTTCANIVCGNGSDKVPFEFGIAPQSQWAGIIAGSNLESAVEWSILQGADTYSMSFSIPNLGEMRSHWRKVMEHGSFCGVYFVSGAGNFAQTAKTPVQMRTPEDIPDVVFAAAGVQRDLSRTPFSSKGPVHWNTEHYNDQTVQKPEVCAFNMGLPMLLPNGTIRPNSANGNSFAGPMFCGSIALMLSADPDLLPWDLKEIITSTATDVASKGIDYETGHGLINCYRAVKEVLRRKAIREGKDAKPFTGRIANDALEVKKYIQSLQSKQVTIRSIRNTQDKLLKQGDWIQEIDGKPVTSAEQLQKLITSSTQSAFEFKIERSGKTEVIKISKPLPQLRLSQVFTSRVFE